MNRRNFIKNMGLYATTLSPLARVGGTLGLLSGTTLSAQSFSGYKAIVIFDMDGGNDAMNMFPPTGKIAHNTYKEIRTNLGVELYKKDENGDYTTDKIDLYDDEYYKIDANQHFTASLGANQPYFVSLDPDDDHTDGPVTDTEYGKAEMYIKGSYDTKEGLGIHALMPEIASLYKKGVLSIISNTGILIEPTTKAKIDAGSANLPEFLFSHGNQRELIATLQAGQVGGKSGWAGRLADSWNINGSLGLNISYGGSTKTFMGLTTSALTMGTRGPTSYASTYLMEDFENVLLDFANNTQNTNIFDKFTNILNKKTATLSKELSSSWEGAPTFISSNSYGEPLFTLYTGNGTTRDNLGIRTHHGLDKRIFNQLESTAKMIKISKDGLSVQRQIFYVRQAGHDVHGKQIDTHSKLMRAVSLGVSDFYKALEEMGLEKDVLLVSVSEFGRTMRNNGDGTDHGWGGHSFMLCGDPNFNGGKVYGDVLTDLNFTGVNAYTSRARIIPTTAIEQMLAPALDWFGVDNATMEKVLPNLKNFRTEADNAKSAFLQDVFV